MNTYIYILKPFHTMHDCFHSRSIYSFLEAIRPQPKLLREKRKVKYVLLCDCSPFSSISFGLQIILHLQIAAFQPPSLSTLFSPNSRPPPPPKTAGPPSLPPPFQNTRPNLLPPIWLPPCRRNLLLFTRNTMLHRPKRHHFIKPALFPNR